MQWYNLVSLAGMVVLLAVAWAFSNERKNLNWRVIGWGLGLQLLFGLLVFVFIARMPERFNPFLLLNDAVNKVLESASAGAEFVFGKLAVSGELGFILAFQALPTIIFFSALIAILYFVGVMPAVIRFFSRAFTRLMRISGAESVSAASNIFVGVESALSIRPHLARMTRSELCTVLTAGMATVASNVLALYIVALRDQFSTIAAHLVSASILSAPAALVMSKIVLPESAQPETLGIDVEPHYERENNLFEAIINGANAGTRLIVGIVALLIAVLGIVALVNLLVGGVGGWINRIPGLNIDWTLSGLVGYVMYPFALVMGVPPADAAEVAKIIGMRSIETEVPGYFRLAAAIGEGTIQHPRSIVICAYALCGFAHIASMAIFVGGASALAPSRTRDLSEVAFRALLAATLACLLTGCVAGAFFMEGTLMLR
ncbi:MAG: nucleoside transporter [Chitinivibrionales bacterium]|nr:nucleoside transporter [Chitinivibrionales bacterium]